MTATAIHTSSDTSGSTLTEVLLSRLATLQSERDQIAADSRAEATGDVVDRATNVEASIRLAILDDRIATLLDEIDESRRDHHADGVVSVGDTVTLDLGDGPETFVVGSVEQGLAGVDTVTPTSPLGRAILGAEVGSTVTYSPRPGHQMQARIVSA